MKGELQVCRYTWRSLRIRRRPGPHSSASPQDRAAASDASVRHVGGALHRVILHPPSTEVKNGFTLFEAPDDAAAAAVEIAAVAVGHLRSNRLQRVLSAEEMRAALQQAATAPDLAPKRPADET